MPLELQTPPSATPATPRIDPATRSPAIAERLLAEGLISLVKCAAMLPAVRGK
jgi:hypothetical protein